MPYIQITLHVINSSNNSPVVGAQVYINGTINFDPNQFTVVTDTNGNASFQVLSNLGNQLMQVTANGFQSGTQSISTLTFGPQSINLSLTPVAIQAVTVNLQFVPATAGITWQITSGSPPATFVIASGVSAADGTASTSSTITLGTYNFTANLAGYQSLTTSIVVTAQTSPYTYTLIANSTDTSTQQGNTSGDSSAATTQPTSNISSVTTQAPAASEYIYPNTDYDKYFTIVGARIYIGNLFIDECNTIQYAVQDNAIPAYGYASRYADAYGQGKSLVQGQLTINFVTEGYLYTVLKEYAKYQPPSQFTTPSSNASNTVSQILGMMATRDSYMQQVNNNANSNQPAVMNSAVQAGLLNTQITDMLKTLTPVQLASLSSQRQQQLTTFNDVVGFDNPVYQDILFDLRVELGNEATGVKRIRYIEKCKLIANEQVIAPDGQTILDSYGFIGRRLR